MVHAANLELKSLMKRIMDVQGKVALHEAELHAEVNKVAVEVKDLRVSHTQTSLEL